MLTGIFLLLLTFHDLPLRQVWNPYGPVEFSTYQDCLQAAETLATWMHKGSSYTISCANKETGKVHATWGYGKSDRD